MFERDYLMNLIAQFVAAMRRSMSQARNESNPRAAADTLEAAIGVATEIDGATLLSLAPDSIASILQVSGTDPRVTEYVARSLLLESSYLREAGESALSEVRAAQAYAIARAYGFPLSESAVSDEGLEELFDSGR